MIGRRNSMGREFGAALAVLAIYLLTLLLPLHQAAGLQRDLHGLGFETLATWSVCQSLAEDDQQSPDTTVIKCPAAGQFKDGLAPVETAAAGFVPVVATTNVAYGVLEGPPPVRRPVHSGEPRAPPLA